MTGLRDRDRLVSNSAHDVADEQSKLSDCAVAEPSVELPAAHCIAAADSEETAPRASFNAMRIGWTALGWLAAAAVVNVVSFVLLSFVRHVATSGTMAGYVALPTTGLWDVLTIFLPLGAVGLGGMCLLFEAWVIGWERSALRRLLQPASHSTRTDLFYAFLMISGLKSVLVFLFTLGAGLGIGYWVSARIQEGFGISLLADAPFLLSLAIVAVVNTFTFYWVHRIMHSRFLWEIHKVHHAAEEMNIITPHRNHPLDHAVVLAVNALPAAILGASGIVVLTWIAINGVYQQMVHTDLDWNLRRWKLGWIERYVLFSSTAHRIHHSRAPRHFDTNFGITPFWDRLFGTYYEPRGEAVRVGLDDETEHNTGHPVRELWRVYWKGMRIAGRELVKPFRPRQSEDRPA